MKDLPLDSAFLALKGEIVERDIYHMRDLADVVSVNDSNFIHEKGHKRGFDFDPDVIFDFGANIGLFTKYARDLFPKAKIVSVEPHPANHERLMQTVDSDNNCHVFNWAIGRGYVYRSVGASNGSGECYLTKAVGYERIESLKLPKSEISSRTIFDVLCPYLRFTERKIVVKIDIEGGENSILDHELSKEVLRMCDYIAMEVHWFALEAEGVQRVRDKTMEFFHSFEPTHNITIDNCYFYATKK